MHSSGFTTAYLAPNSPLRYIFFAWSVVAWLYVMLVIIVFFRKKGEL